MNNLELEIAQLQQKIEEKKNLLEQQGGIIEEKELVSASLKEMFTGSSSTSASSVTNVSAPNTRTASNQSASYLDTVDDQTAETIGLLIQKLPELGIAKVMAEAEAGGPFLVDVMHDALVDKMYDELVKRGLLK